MSIPIVDPAVYKRFEDIRSHPERHRHSYDALRQCCVVNDLLHTVLLEAHEEFACTGTNGGRRCDVTEGPCACGAWH